MPTYVYRCEGCGHQEEKFNRVADYLVKAPECHGEKMRIVIQPVMGFVDNLSRYICPITGEGITSRRQRNESMKRLGVIDANDVIRSPEQRRKDKQRKQEEMNRINAEIAATVPRELSAHMDKKFKTDLKEFVNKQ